MWANYRHGRLLLFENIVVKKEGYFHSIYICVSIPYLFKILSSQGFDLPFQYVPGEIRTPDRRLRRPLLYPAELLGHDINIRIIFSSSIW